MPGVGVVHRVEIAWRAKKTKQISPLPEWQRGAGGGTRSTRNNKPSWGHSGAITKVYSIRAGSRMDPRGAIKNGYSI